MNTTTFLNTLKALPRLQVVLATVATSVSLWIVFSLVTTVLTLFFLKTGNISAATQTAASSLPFARSVSAVTLRKSATIETWKYGFETLSQSGPLYLLVQQYTHDQSFSFASITPELKKLEPSLSKTMSSASRSTIVKRVVSPDQLQLLSSTTPQIPKVIEYLDTVSTGRHTWLVLFQNTEELRATGGFTGSYALVHFNEGKLEEIVIEDIYDADGQFTGFVPAPLGLREYLSSDNGLRLPDANWFPDFPTSAQTTMQFFAFGDRRSIDGVVAVNLEAIEAVVKVVEPLWLPDYKVHATSSNLSMVLREERGQFFPGSQDKKQLLTHVWNQLKLQIQGLGIEGKKQLLSTMITTLKKKDLQFYSSNPELESVFSELGVTGALSLKPNNFLQDETFCTNLSYPGCPSDFFAFIEANVGVNKANKAISRAATIHLAEYRTVVEYTLSNRNVPPTQQEIDTMKTPGATHNGYVNYQRLLVPVDYTLEHVALNTTTVEKIDDEIITTAAGEQLRQIGLLIPISEQQTVTVTYELSHPFKDSGEPRTVTLHKQSGVDGYPVTIFHNEQQQQSLLENDTFITL